MDPSPGQHSLQEVQLDVNKKIDNYNEKFRDAVIVKFHLHTTGFFEPREISQISASYDGELVISEYILPDKDIEEKATRESGLIIKKIGGERKLYLNKSEVNSVRPKEGLAKFLEQLGEKFGHKVILAAHNFHTYTGIIIVRELQKHELIATFKSIVLGFVDTLPMFKLLLEERKKEKKSFQLIDLATDYNITVKPVYLNGETLDLLMTKIGCTDEFMRQHAKDLTRFIELLLAKDDLAPLGNQVTRKMKIAKAGISMNTLNNVYRESGENGISMLLKEDVEGKPRVTNRAKSIKSIVNALTQPKNKTTGSKKKSIRDLKHLTSRRKKIGHVSKA